VKALGSVKPGRFRGTLVVVLVALLDYAARHVYGRGHLTRVQTIHFARWVFIDGGRRLLFASNYDGILESYMDDFINKVAWGLNLVFSNGVGYPRTRWLVQGGARDSQAFKNYLRRHQVVNSVWYKANAGLTAMDLARHGRIREGLDRPAMSDAEIEDWLRSM
jgi:phage tail protein X